MISLSWLSHALSQSCPGANIHVHLSKRKPFHLKSIDHKETRIRISAKTSGIITLKLSNIYYLLASCMATLFPWSWFGISCCFVGYVTMLINNALVQKGDCIICIFYSVLCTSIGLPLPHNISIALLRLQKSAQPKHFNVLCILFFDKLEPLAVTSRELTCDWCHRLEVRLWPLMIALTFTLLWEINAP